MVTQIQSPSTFQRFSPSLTEVGLSNTRLNRPGNYTHDGSGPGSPTGLDLQGSEMSNGRLFNPCEVKPDYLRVNSFIPVTQKFDELLAEFPDRAEHFDIADYQLSEIEERVKELVRFMTPSQRGVGFPATVALLDAPFTLVPGIKVFENAYKDASTGTIIAWEPKFEEDGNILGAEVILQISGQYFENTDLMEILRIFKGLKQEWNFEGMRCDLKSDFPKSWGILDKAIDYAKEYKFNRLKSQTYIRSGKKGEKDSEYQLIGARESAFCMRVYDTEAKHGYKADRMESEFKKGKAIEVFNAIANIEFYSNPDDKQTRLSNLEIRRNAQKAMANIHLGQFDFCDDIEYYSNGSYKNVAIAPWWQKLKDTLLAHAPHRITVPAPEKSLAKTTSWLYRQVAKTLTVMCQGLGKQRFEKLTKSLIDEGKKRLNNLDKALIASIRGMSSELSFESS